MAKGYKELFCRKTYRLRNRRPMEKLNLQLEAVKLLKEKKLTLSVAESLTGGLISSKICEISGASEVFLEGIISYSNESKISRLGIEKSVIERFSPVSYEVATRMAEGVRRNLKADIGISSTGVAGPAAYDSDGNKRGLFFIGLSLGTETLAAKYEVEGSRQHIRDYAANQALRLLIEAVSKVGQTN